MTRRLVLAAGALAAALAMAGCGKHAVTTSASQPTTVRVVTSGESGKAVLASAGGALSQAGIRLQETDAANGAAAVAALSKGNADLALASAPDVLEARDHGNRVVSVMALVPASATALVYLGKQSLGALAAKPVGTSGTDYERAFAQTIFNRGVRVTPYGADPVGALTGKKVLAVLADPAIVTDRRLHGRKPAAKPVDQLGVPRYDGAVLVANQESLGSLGNEIRTIAGAVAHSRSAPRTAGTPLGWQEPAQWNAIAAYLRAKGLLKAAPQGAFTNQYLPGQGL